MKQIEIDLNTKWWNLYPNILFTKVKKGPLSLPEIEILQQNVPFDAKEIGKYNQLCEIEETVFVPPTYLHIICMPSHLSLLTHKDTGLALFGLIHLSNRIKQFRGIRKSELINIKTKFGQLLAHDKGQAIEIITQIFVKSELVWESSTIFLKKGKNPIGPEFIAKQIDIDTQYTKELWTFSFFLGQKYALISGDFNPIHLFPLSAKLFGMPKHIAHGMYSKAKIMGNIMKEIKSDKFEVTVYFKLPIYLPANVIFRKNKEKELIVFDVVDEKMEKPHLKGYFQTF